MPRPLRIGINALYLIPGGVGGTEIYLRNLLLALSQIDRRNEYFVFTNRETGENLCPQAPNFERVPSAVPARLRPARLLWEQTGLPFQAALRRLDVLFSAGFTSPLLTPAQKVTVIHDLQHKRQPHNFGPLERLAWDFSVWGSVKTSGWLITPSESARRDVVDVYGFPESRVRAVLHGVELDFFGLKENKAYDGALLTQLGIPEQRYLLAVSTLHPHKNWQRLLHAYHSLVSDGLAEHLVVAGLAGKSSKTVDDELSKLGLTERVHILGWQPRRALLVLFKFAEALVFPSTFEGFGIPVLEAQAAGLAVTCSDIAPLREIANGAAVFFDPTNVEDIARGIRTVLTDLGRRDENVSQGLIRTRDFTWRRSAEQTLAVLLEAGRS